MAEEKPKQITRLGQIMLVLGTAMLIYWGMYLNRGYPRAGIPLLSEIANAVLALLSGFGLLRTCPWGFRLALFTAGMWAYGALGGINLVFEHGLNFTSPFGALTDAILFPLILIFAFYIMAVIWRNRVYFL